MIRVLFVNPTGGFIDPLGKDGDGIITFIGARARFILEEALALPGPQRALYLNDLQGKGVLTDPVADQIAELFAARHGSSPVHTTPPR